MNGLDLLKEVPGRVDPPDQETRDRIRTLMESRIRSGRPHRPRRAARGTVLAAAAVLTVGLVAAAVTQHLWTDQQPVAIPIETSPGPDTNFGCRISDPNGPILTPDDLTSAVAEFTPAIRLPEWGSFDQWRDQFATHLSQNGGSARSEVALDMVVVSECQWAQEWLDASAHGDQAGAAQSITVLGRVDEWLHAAGLSDEGYMAGLIGQMGKGDGTGIQLFENQQCSFTGSWGTTAAQQDAKATGDLGPAIQTAQDYLRSGGNPLAFDPEKAQGLAPNVFWTWAHMQPVPARPGAIFITEPAGGAVTLVSTSESGTQFCAIVTGSSVVHGTTTNDLSIVPAGDGAQAATPGPMTCTPGAW